MRVNELCCKDDDSNSVACDRCGSKESSCKCGRPCRPDHEVLVNKVVCSKQVDIVAETIIALSSLGITLPPRATTLPPITVTPDRLGIVQNSIILKDEVTTTGLYTGNNHGRGTANYCYSQPAISTAHSMPRCLP